MWDLPGPGLEPVSPALPGGFFFFFLWYVGLSLLWPLPLRSTGSGRAGSAAMAHRPSRSAACGIFPDRGTNPCPPHRQADSQPLRHQGSPRWQFLKSFFLKRGCGMTNFISTLCSAETRHKASFVSSTKQEASHLLISLGSNLTVTLNK